MTNLNRILLARDFSPVSNQALRYAVDLAQRTGSELHVLYAQVLYEDPFGSNDETPIPGADVEAIRDKLAATDKGAPLNEGETFNVVNAVERDVAAGPAILRYAKANDIDLITMGTHGRRGMRRMLMGSVAEEVVRHADRPVVTVRGAKDEATDVPPSIDQILVPIDFSEHSREALRTARGMADLYDARLDVLHVIEERLHPAFYVGGVQSIDELDPELDTKGKQALETFVDETPGPDVEVVLHVVRGRAARRIPTFVQAHGIDLLALSTHGQTGLERFLLGSVAEKVIRHVECPVLTVKAFGRSLVDAADTTDADAEPVSTAPAE